MKKNILERFFLRFFKDIPYLCLTLKKSQIKNTNALFVIKERAFHFQYAFEMPEIFQDFPYPRYENMLVAADILKSVIKKNTKHNISICESAPLDGYITWRLSPLQLSKKYDVTLNALEIQKGNCEKIELVAKAFGYHATVHNASIEEFRGGSFDFFTMLGVTYQLPSPLKTLNHIFAELLKPKAVFYFDFIHPENLFSKYGFHEREKIETHGILGVRYELADERTEEENAYYLNHPTSAISTILYSKASMLKFFAQHPSIKFEEIYVSNSPTYTMNTYRATKIN